MSDSYHPRLKKLILEVVENQLLPLYGQLHNCYAVTTLLWRSRRK
jgi:hypothetical protein